LAKADIELKAWFAQSVAFDRAVAAELSRVATPAGLKDEILAQRKIIGPVPWWGYRLSPPQLAAAAVIVLTLFVSGLWFTKRPARFADFTRDIVDRSWGGAPHLELETADIQKVRGFLAEQKAPTDFELPPILAKSIAGCSVVHWRGQKIPVICFTSGAQHFHMMVTDRELFPDAPNQMPEIDRWDAWRTASWSKDAHTYVVTGLSSTAFFKKFRKSKHWDWEG
jgi:hypothetical protein